MAYQPPALEVGQHRHLLCNGTICRTIDLTHRSIVNDVELSRPKLRRLSSTPLINSCEEMAGCHDPSPDRRAPSLVTITNPVGYGCRACRMIWLVTCGP